MADNTKIEWATASWSPITGCTPISEGCQNCYARRMAIRLGGRFGYPQDDPFRVTFHPDRLGQPERWRKSRRIFVCSMGDLFHENIHEETIRDLFAIMVHESHHTYLLLTKRPERMDHIIDWIGNEFPLGRKPNIWLGVSVENQARADERIPILLQIPAVVKFVSIEPMLGPVDISKYLRPGSRQLDWVIMGAESGPKARPMRYEWAFDIADQCQAAGVPLFYKQGPDDNGNWCKMPALQGLVWNAFPIFK